MDHLLLQMLVLHREIDQPLALHRDPHQCYVEKGWRVEEQCRPGVRLAAPAAETAALARARASSLHGRHTPQAGASHSAPTLGTPRSYCVPGGPAVSAFMAAVRVTRPCVSQEQHTAHSMHERKRARKGSCKMAGGREAIDNDAPVPRRQRPSSAARPPRRPNAPSQAPSAATISSSLA